MGLPVALAFDANLTKKWIYWRYKNSLRKTLSLDRVQNHITKLNILELTDTSVYTCYPTRVNLEDIDIFGIEEKSEQCSFESCFINKNE